MSKRKLGSGVPMKVNTLGNLLIDVGEDLHPEWNAHRNTGQPKMNSRIAPS
jgi:hypothetical protein